MLNERNWGKLLYFIGLWLFSSSADAGLPNILARITMCCNPQIVHNQLLRRGKTDTALAFFSSSG
ncbi:hypothetical protein ABLV66_12310 [Klebsiella sp. CN_Kp073]|uniref:hypothetical protein n=1 Tax=Klebsiella sp. CN_Kp073 TaxID=3153412 RepID=UPI0012DF2E0E